MPAVVCDVRYELDGRSLIVQYDRVSASQRSTVPKSPTRGATLLGSHGATSPYNAYPSDLNYPTQSTGKRQSFEQTRPMPPASPPLKSDRTRFRGPNYEYLGALEALTRHARARTVRGDSRVENLPSNGPDDPQTDNVSHVPTRYIPPSTRKTMSPDLSRGGPGADEDPYDSLDERFF